MSTWNACSYEHGWVRRPVRHAAEQLFTMDPGNVVLTAVGGAGPAGSGVTGRSPTATSTASSGSEVRA